MQWSNRESNLYHICKNDFLLALPTSVVVQFDNYKGPSFVDTFPNIVPICPITITADTVKGFYE